MQNLNNTKNKFKKKEKKNLIKTKSKMVATRGWVVEA